MRHLYRLRKEEYSQGANFCLQNAKNILSVSNQSANINQFAIANSLLITSIEELAKASVLKIKSINNNIRIDNLNEYFWSHTVKHKSIYKIFFASLSFSIPESSNKKQQKNKDNEFWITILIIIIILGLVVYFFRDQINEDKNSFTTNEDDDSMEKLRRSGLYVGFDSENRTWEVPSRLITKESYEEFKDMVDLAFLEIEHALFDGKIHKENIIEFADKLKDDKIITKDLKDIKSKIVSSEESNPRGDIPI